MLGIQKGAGVRKIDFHWSHSKYKQPCGFCVKTRWETLGLLLDSWIHWDEGWLLLDQDINNV